MVLWVNIRLFSGCLVLITGIYNVKAWTYHYNIDTDVDWIKARQWCQKNFTDMVAIQNQAEVAYLNQILPFHPTYYWIGIRKIDGHWTWVGTKKHLVPEAENWAKNEPNNQGNGQDCVEIYIKRQKDTAKWNDERCNKKKAALCYLASCSDKSCSQHAECVETIGSYTCQCDPGFMGPRCEEVVQCWPVKNPQQGFVKCDGVFGAFHFNSSCQFQCATGFKLEGEQRLHCLASGHWDKALPVCQAVQCLPIIDAPGGWSMNCTHPLSMNSFNSSCEFKCEEGFELQGSSTTWCDHTGHWTHKTPTCTVVTCNPILAPEKSNLTCADPLGKFSFRSSCNATCEEGYTLRGESTLTCQSDSNWSAPTPTCEVVKCDPLKPSPHGSLQCYDPMKEFAYGSTCWVKCDFGFVHNGTNSTHCTAHGNWSHILPVCHAIQCPPLSNAPSYGSMNCTHPLSNNSFNSSCEFKCEEGFVLRGADSTFCDHTGHWTHSTPICTAVACDPLGVPAQSNLTCADPLGKFSFRSSCNATCEEGYTLRGESTLTCQSDGNWSAPTPACEVVKCDPLKPSPHGSLQCYDPMKEFAYGSTCWVKCDFGFVRNGTNSTHCTAHGNWSHILPVCHAIQCPPLSNAPSYGSMNCTHPLSNNSFNSSCEFKCEEGFVLRGADSTFCDHTGHWTHSTPICTAVACDPLGVPAQSHLTCADPLGKFSFRSSCNATCEEGYTLRGESTLTCQSDGNWSAPTPACEVVKCDPLKPSPHGSLQCYEPMEEFAYGSTCLVKCDFGFVHNGTNSTHCTAHGNWSHILPVCHAIQCPPLSNAPSYGSMNCTHPLSNNSFNSSCEFKCEEGFVLRGADSTFCDHTGHWTHSTPICTAVACDPLVVPAQSHLTCADPLGKFSFRSSCNATCEEGYTLRGESTLTCQSDGNWSAPTPTCGVKRCDALETFQHGVVQCQDRLEKFSYGSLCWLQCGAGFTLNGSNSTYCTSQGKWSQDLPVCQARQCSPLADPSHGTVTCTHPHGQFSFGTVCEVSCQAGFKLHGTPRMECLEMGKWTDTPPFCLAQQCPLLTTQENGWMNCSHPHSMFSYGSQCFLGCEAGFEMTGEPGMECSASGNWSQEMPSCTAVRCEPLSFSQLPELGPPPSMNCSHPHGNFSFGSQCFFKCATSHELSGTSQLICTSKGSWTNSPPSCVVQEMSVSAGMLMYAAVGVASSAGLLLLGGLIFLLMRQFAKKAHYSPTDSSWEGELNPVFEFN